MKPLEHVEKLIKGFEVEINQQKNQRVLNGLLETQARSRELKPDLLQPNIWRMVLHSKLAKLAAAAVIVVAVIVGINHFGGSIDVTGVAWGEVRSAFLQQLWVHLKYDNGEESWYNLRTGDHCAKQLHWR